MVKKKKEINKINVPEENHFFNGLLIGWIARQTHSSEGFFFKQQKKIRKKVFKKTSRKVVMLRVTGMSRKLTFLFYYKWITFDN